jgi:cytochrome c oxidase cbb3-type subunit I/II
VFGPPAVVAAIGVGLLALFGLGNPVTAPAWLILLVSIGGGTLFLLSLRKPGGAPTWHRIVEGRAAIFTALTVVAVLVGGVAEIVPALIVAPPPVKPGEAGPHVLTAL